MADDMNDKLLKKDIENLKKNPVFNMSLSGKELFHSNMLAMFLTDTLEDNITPSNIAKVIMNFFPPAGEEEGIKDDTVIFDVLREKFHLDLIAIYCTKKQKESLYDDYKCYSVDDIDFYEKEQKDNNTSDSDDNESFEELNENKEKNKKIAEIVKEFKYVIIENKFKSFPYIEQLNEYSNKKLILFKFSKKKCGINIDFDPSYKRYLFAPEESLNTFYKTNNNKQWHTNAAEEKVDWEGKSYNEYSTLLKEYVNINKDKSLTEDDTLAYLLVNEYQHFLDKMLSLYKEQIVKERIDKNKLFLSEEQNHLFLRARVQDFYEKILFNQILSKLKNDLGLKDNFTKLENGTNEPFLYSGINYTRQSGIYDFRYLWLDNNITQGIQIQNNRFEIVICADFNFYKKAENWNEIKETYQKTFESYFEKFKGECKTYSENLKEGKKPEESSQIKWIRKIHNEIKNKYKAENLELKFKKNSHDLAGYTTKDYVFRYAYIDLNSLAPNNNYREIEYDTIRDLLKVALEVITDPANRYKISE